MNEILIITGACGVGKTTTGVAWAKLKDGACIECDYLTEWIHKKDFGQWTEEEEAFTANLTVKITQAYLDYNMSVAIENVWTPFGLEILIDQLFSKVQGRLKIVYLKCELQENHRRDELRIPENRMYQRVDIVNRQLSEYECPNSVQIIDTTDLNVTEIIDLVEKSI